MPEYGGLTRLEGRYLAGPPELIIEIAHSSAAIDLHAKKNDYQRTGVREYLVVCTEEKRIAWFELSTNRERKLPRDGILRSRMFPGFWVEAAALFRRDTKRLIGVLEQGLADESHRKFVDKLAAACRESARGETKHRK